MRTCMMAILILGLVGAAARPGANAAADVAGKVVDKDGEPVAGARVLSYLISFPPPSATLERETTTDQNGAFTLTGLRPLGSGGMMGMMGRSVVVLAEGYAVGGTTSEGFGRMEPGPLVLRLRQSADASGKVTGPDGKPVAGATVRVLGIEQPSTEGIGGDFLWLWDTAGSVTAETDAAGAFKLKGLPAEGGLVLYIEHPNYASQMSQGTAVGTEGLTVALQEAGSMEGRVALQGTAQGVAQAKVFCIAEGSESSWGWTVTDAEGRYRITGLGTSEYEVMVFPAAEGAEWVSTGMQRASVVAGRAAQVDLEVVRGELVKGRVVDAESSQPVAGVSIQWGEGVSGPPTVAATKEDGTFELRVAPGSVDLRIADVPKGYVPPEEPTTVQVVPDEGATGVELKILRGVSLAGRVVGPNGQAVPQAQVRTDDWQILATADEQGQFSLDGLAPGRSLRVWVSAPKQGWSGEATVKAQKGAKPLTLKLGPAAQVEVRVVDREGKPIPKPHVYAMMGVSVDGSTSYRGGLGFETRQDGKGTCTVVGLLSSHHYYVSASAEGYGSAQTPPFILKAGEKKKLSPLVLRKADAVLTGRVTDPSGKPVAGAVVQSSGRPATTDEQGRYRIENLVHGQGAYVRVSHPNYEEDYQYNVDPDAGPVNLVLTPKFIPAKVLAKPGEPAPELACAHWLNSERLTWKKLEGKVVLLAFSAAGAGPCERLLPTLQDLHERHAAQGFTVLQVQDRSLPLGELRTWVQKRSLSYPVAMVQSGLYDGWASETFQNYGVQAVPMLFLIDRAGILHPVESMAGLSEQVEKLLAER